MKTSGRRGLYGLLGVVVAAWGVADAVTFASVATHAGCAGVDGKRVAHAICCGATEVLKAAGTLFADLDSPDDKWAGTVATVAALGTAGGRTCCELTDEASKHLLADLEGARAAAATVSAVAPAAGFVVEDKPCHAVEERHRPRLEALARKGVR